MKFALTASWRSAWYGFSIGFCFGVLAAPAGAGVLDDVKELLGISGSDTEAAAGLSQDEIGAGLKEALNVGTKRVVRRLGASDGFNADPKVHIPLPESLAKAKSMLGTVGMGGIFDDLELRMNRAAEAATPKARALFVEAIQDITLDDVMDIYNGPDDAATRYFESRMSAPLGQEMRPIVDQGLAEAGAVQVYDSVMREYDKLPFAPTIDTDLTGYVVDKSMDGIFFYLAREEAAIRNDPLKRSTDLLKRVFGQ